MGIWECAEKAKEFRWISDKARSAWFGLESYLDGRPNGGLESLKRPLTDGLDVCNLLEEAVGAIASSQVSSNKISPDMLASFYRFKPVRKDLEETFGGIDTIEKEVKKNKEFLKRFLKALEENELSELSSDSVRETQKFFNKISTPYLKISYSWLRRAHV